MSLLNTPTAENATGEVKEIFNEVESMIGMLPNSIKLWSVSPEALKVQWNSIKVILSKDEENQKLHAIIRYLMSEKNDCKYCIGFNSNMLINMFGFTQDELTSIQKNPSSAPLDEKNRALLVFAMKSVKNADDVNADDIEKLKQLGISEMEMFDIVLAASHMFAVNTLFKTFKVEQN